ncbi:FAD dependent oxidoreductase [Methylobacterium sp. 4-46]|uniref:NAD(P)/FAD-dependent oxidoreductase n=1 Tax=unclassified Methylobacterium TaxID=2615210 RepID=UPI000152D53D|nr:MULTISPECIES: NAD(P)/FAD-dependent oxidoreductase [Methylobacterium]ACA14795.1 FAD dependent oxidoreductase [Methylobacterium sp. 4-46]WFT80542.1 NAD(P)/FAD-dependent oxidoreductase [Methylobacterium nodulans]
MLVLVIGAGVVGLACGRALALRGHEVIVAEAEAQIGTGVSSRNSEVIHGGMYYPSGSLRARHCVEGRRRLYAFCASHGVPHARTGKLIVAATEPERAKIAAIHAQGLANGVEGLALIDGAEARRLEPNLACVAALLSPETGIVDSHALMLALQGDLEAHGGALAFRTPVERLIRDGGGWVALYGGEAPGELRVDAVVSATSFGAQALARATEGYPEARVPRLVLAKGNYFGCLGRPAFTRLIYPAPVEGGLGIHLTLDLAGRTRFGPDVEWIDRPDYEVDPARGALFYAAIRRYWPDLPEGALFPDYAGIRPKLSGPGQPAMDFVIDGPAEHGLPGLVQMFGIESPGLTSSLSLAEDVADRLGA